MKIIVAGGTGLIGSNLVPRLLGRGIDVAVLTRNPAHVPAGRGVAWDGKTQGPWSAEVADADGVINLAGENIGAGRWTEERKRRLMNSRLCATHALVDALKKAPTARRTLINASAVGFYGAAHGDEILDEDSPRGEGFLADLTSKWEAAARDATAFARVIVFRFGVVLSSRDGALAKMVLPFRLGAGGPVGSGKQWMSWVALDDVLRAIEWAIDDEKVRGIYNVTAPAPVRNREFATALGHVLHRPSFMPAPAFALQLLFGEMADEVLLGGQRVVPNRATKEGFVFEHPEIGEALQHVLNG